jgi:BirA family biotin operon repressor/biotin-[acetyl-CoA-carboxylase] ligase
MSLSLKIHNPWDGAAVHVIERTSSTMDDAFELARAGCAPGTAVIAGFQERGRGRAPGRVWHAPPWESLLLTVVLFRRDLPFALPQLPLRAALAVCRSVDRHLPSPARIKWPNDVTFAGRKLAGVICEGRGEAVLVGAGVNCAQKDFPPEIAGSSCSLFQAGGAEVTPFALAGVLLAELYGVLADSRWLGEVRERLALRGTAVTIGAPGSVAFVRGTVEDVGEDGELLLRTAGGRLSHISQGEITRSP